MNKHPSSTPTNLVQATKKPRRDRRRRRWKQFFVVLGVLLVAIGVGAAILVPAATKTYASAQQAQEQLLVAQQELSAQNLPAAQEAIQNAQTHLEQAQTSSLALQPLRLIPYAGRNVKASRQLIAAGIELTKGVDIALETGKAITAPLELTAENDLAFDNIEPEQKREMLQALADSSDQLKEVATHFAAAETHLANVPESALVGPLQEAVTQVQSQLPQLTELTEAVSMIATIVPQLAGYPEQQDYLLLFQNNTELRPAGGFIGSYGILNVKDGELQDLQTFDSYALDDPADISIEAPWQFKKLTNPNLDSWYFRDSNWSPDFPTAAENALFFYKEEGGEGDFAGVISFTPTFLEHLLEVVGPVQVPTRTETFTSENVTSLIQYETNVSFRLLETRKDIIGELGNVIVEQLLSLPREKWVLFAEKIQEAFDEKQLMVYMRNQEAQDIIEEQGWAASVTQNPSSDYVQLVDANMASLKTDPFVSRNVEYTVDFSRERPRATYRIQYTNSAPGFSFKTTRYRTWARVFAPAGSELVSIEGQDTPADYYLDPSTPYEITEEPDLNKVSFGTFIVTEIGETRDVTFTYDLPKEIGDAAKRGEYSLIMQKQPGVLPFDVSVDVTGLPDEKDLQGPGEREKKTGPFTHTLGQDAIWALPNAQEAPTPTEPENDSSTSDLFSL